MNVGDEDVMSGFATLLPGAEGDEEGADAGEGATGWHYELACSLPLFAHLTVA